MWKKVIVYFLVAVIAFAVGTVSTGKLFAAKDDDAVMKKLDEILKKIEQIDKNQQEMQQILKRLQYRNA